MHRRAELIIETAEEMLLELNPRNESQREMMHSLLRIIEHAQVIADDFNDVESELDFIRRQYQGYPPFPLDNVDLDEDDEDVDKDVV
ncbi:MAG: hypothetical protein SF029_10255 [bacterium]|nr:hypothetical protein [bacterium]